MTAKCLVVTHCSACPFFEDSPLKKLGGLGGLITAAIMGDSQHGICNLLPSDEFVPSTDLKIGLPPGPDREAEEFRLAKARTRRVVADKRTIPQDCPLRQDDWTITLARGN